MRDVKRIPKILKRLEKIWKAHPDLRLGQLIINVTRQPSLPLPYDIEDEALISNIEKYYQDIKFVYPKEK